MIEILTCKRKGISPAGKGVYDEAKVYDEDNDDVNDDHDNDDDNEHKVDDDDHHHDD